MKRRTIPISKLIPNLITIGALCCGLSAIRFAIIGELEMAITFILIAAFLDAIDGRVARMLKATSDFGAQMDSLSDLICFGAAPALILHLWVLQDVKRFGWAVALIYCVCCALRLARFNTSLMEEKTEDWQEHYFTGTPAPASAGLALLPLMLSLQFGEELLAPYTVEIMMVYLPCISLLMVSRLPTFSLKGHHIPRIIVLPVMLGCILAVIGLIIETWLVVSALMGLYLLSIPFSALGAHRKSEQNSD